MKKNKNNLSKTSSVLVSFYPSTQEEINQLLNSLNISGVCVSSLIDRWAIEVPFWKENYYIEKLTESELVRKVHTGVYSKKIFNNEEREDELDEK